MKKRDCHSEKENIDLKADVALLQNKMNQYDIEKMMNKYIIDINGLSKIDLTIAPRTSKFNRSFRKLNHNKIVKCHSFDNQFSPAMEIYAKILILQKLNAIPSDVADNFDIEYGIVFIQNIILNLTNQHINIL